MLGQKADSAVKIIIQILQIRRKLLWLGRERLLSQCFGFLYYVAVAKDRLLLSSDRPQANKSRQKSQPKIHKRGTMAAAMQARQLACCKNRRSARPANQSDHHSLDDQFRCRNQIRIRRILCFQKGFASFELIALERDFTVNQRGHYVALVRHCSLQQNSVSIENLGPDHRLTPHL